MITGPLLAEMRKDIDAALADVGTKHNVVIKAGGASYARDGSNATFKLSLSSIGDGGEVVTKEASDFKARAAWYKLKPEDLGRTFASGGKRYTITGLTTRSRTNPILALQKVTGKTYKFPADVVRAMLETTASK